MERYNPRRVADNAPDLENSCIARRLPYINEYWHTRKQLDAAIAAVDEETAALKERLKALDSPITRGAGLLAHELMISLNRQEQALVVEKAALIRAYLDRSFRCTGEVRASAARST